MNVNCLNKFTGKTAYSKTVLINIVALFYRDNYEFFLSVVYRL